MSDTDTEPRCGHLEAVPVPPAREEPDTTLYEQDVWTLDAEDTPGDECSPPVPEPRRRHRWHGSKDGTCCRCGAPAGTRTPCPGTRQASLPGPVEGRLDALTAMLDAAQLDVEQARAERDALQSRVDELEGERIAYVRGGAARIDRLPRQHDYPDTLRATAWCEGWDAQDSIEVRERDADPRPVERQRLPVERQSITHRFDVGGHTGYITAGTYPDGRLGEVFVVARQGSTIGGFVDALATVLSIALQYRIPLSVFAEKFRGVTFPPNGYSTHPDIGYATSLIDYLFRWLELRFPEAPC